MQLIKNLPDFYVPHPKTGEQTPSDVAQKLLETDLVFTEKIEGISVVVTAGHVYGLDAGVLTQERLDHLATLPQTILLEAVWADPRYVRLANDRRLLLIAAIQQDDTGEQIVMSWKDTEALAEQMHMLTVPSDGVLDPMSMEVLERQLRNITRMESSFLPGKRKGEVARPAKAFPAKVLHLAYVQHVIEDTEIHPDFKLV